MARKAPTGPHSQAQNTSDRKTASGLKVSRWPTIVGVMKVKYVGARFERAVAYHPSCHLMRELKVREEPMMLLSAVGGIRLVEVRDREECCGLGGLFSVKFPHISGAMLEDKLARIVESGAQVVVSNDCGCLMQIGGALHRAGSPIEVLHLAEVLAAR